MFAPRYFPVRYFAPRSWPPGMQLIVLVGLGGKQLTIFPGQTIAVEEQLTEVNSPTYRDVRSKLYIEHQSFVLRADAVTVIGEVQTIDPFTATIVVTTTEGREITALAADIAAVQELIPEPRSPIYQGDRSRMFFGVHAIDVRLTADALITLIEAA